MTASLTLTHECITPAEQPPSLGNTINILALSSPGLLREAVIRPTLNYLGIASRAAENLLLGTLLATTSLPAHKQAQGGIGPYGICTQLHTRIWDDYLASNPDQASLIRGLASQRCFLHNPHAELGYNFAYATAIAWLIYHQQLTELEDDMDIDELALIWETRYPHRGALSSDFLASWNRVRDEESLALV